MYANALGTADTQLRDLARTLGASGFRTNLTLMRETFWSMVLSVTASFNRCFGELGIATLVGGSLLGNGTLFGGTRVLTTSIAFGLTLETFRLPWHMRLVLMVIVVVLALAISLIERVKNEGGDFRKFILWRGVAGG